MPSSHSARSLQERGSKRLAHSSSIRAASTPGPPSGKGTSRRLPNPGTSKRQVLARAVSTSGRDRGVSRAATTFLQGVVFGSLGALGGVGGEGADMADLGLVAAEGADEAALLVEVVEEALAAGREGEDVVARSGDGGGGGARGAGLVAFRAGVVDFEEVLHVDFLHLGFAIVVGGGGGKRCHWARDHAGEELPCDARDVIVAKDVEVAVKHGAEGGLGSEGPRRWLGAWRAHAPVGGRARSTTSAADGCSGAIPESFVLVAGLGGW